MAPVTARELAHSLDAHVNVLRVEDQTVVFTVSQDTPGTYVRTLLSLAADNDTGHIELAHHGAHDATTERWTATVDTPPTPLSY